MTAVEVLCLNHRERLGIAWVYADEDEHTFHECVAAGHRHFHFYGGITNSTPYSWIHPMSDFKSIKNALQTEIFMHGGHKIDVDRYFDVWKTLVSKTYAPEWFLFVPKTYFGKDDKVISPQIRSLDSLIDTLTIKQPTSELSQSEIVKIARARKQAYYDMQRIDKKSEDELFSILKKWQRSDNLEQQWFGIMSMNHYLKHDISDLENFYSWLCKNLRSESYLIRVETRDMLQRIFATNPARILELIEKLNGEREFPLQVIGFDLVCRMFSGHYYSGRYHKEFTESHRPIRKGEYPRFKDASEAAAMNVLDWVHHLISLGSYWSEDKMIRKEIQELERGLPAQSQDDFEYHVYMTRLVSRLRLAKKGFHR
ncbi:MAG: hypothetical protein RTV31_15060 [Candidatus Thorarchaeota archaeon]